MKSFLSLVMQADVSSSSISACESKSNCLPKDEVFVQSFTQVVVIPVGSFCACNGVRSSGDLADDICV